MDEWQRRRTLDAEAEGAESLEMQALRLRLRSLEEQKMKLMRRARALRRQVVRCNRERAKLKVRMTSAEQEIRHAVSRYAEAEERSSHFVSLYVVSQRLTGLRTYEEVWTAVQEIVAAFIGSEEIAVFELDSTGAAVMRAACGVDAATYLRASSNEGIVGRVVGNGQAYHARQHGRAYGEEAPGQSEACIRGDSDVTACVPLKVDGCTVGALTIFRLLPQKAALGPDDYELLDVLATRAAEALDKLRRGCRIMESP